MIRRFYLLATIAAIGLVSCQDTELINELTPDQSEGVLFSVPTLEAEEGSRVDVTVDAEGAHFTWALGDTIGVFPLTGYQTAFPISKGIGSSSAKFDGSDWALRPESRYAAYFPFQRGMDFSKDKIAVTYTGQTQRGNNNTSHIGNYDYLASTFTQVLPDGTANFDMNHLGSLIRFTFVMPAEDTYSMMVISNTTAFTTDATFSLSDNQPKLTSVKTCHDFVLNLKDIATTTSNNTLVLYMMLPPADYRSSVWSVRIVGKENVYAQTLVGKNVVAGKCYAYNTTTRAINAATMPRTYVDLGLPSRTKWATCNIGARTPQQYGKYFAWGETISYGDEDFSNGVNYSYNMSGGQYSEESDPYTKLYFSAVTYKYCNGSIKNLVKYCDDKSNGIVDNRRALEVFDDAATINWGGNWCMPTNAQMNELRNECYWEWTTNYNGSKVAGFIVYRAMDIADKGKCSFDRPTLTRTYTTSNIHIFLPAGGRYIGDAQTGSGAYGYYWTSELDTDPRATCNLTISANRVLNSTNCYRYYGLPIRPVRK